MTRAQLHSKFAAEFHRGPRPAKVSPAALDSLEQDLGMLFPEAYRTFLLQQGPMATPTIPDVAQEARADVWPIQEFCPPADVLAATRSAWKSGLLPRSLVVFAKGPYETLFCLERGQKGRRRADDGAVWALDPIAESPTRMTDSFDDWLREHLDAAYGDEHFLEEMDDVTWRTLGKEFKKRTKP